MIVIHRDRDDKGWIVSIGVSCGYQSAGVKIYKELIEALLDAAEEAGFRQGFGTNHPVYLDDRRHVKLGNGLVFCPDERQLQYVIYQ